MSGMETALTLSIEYLDGKPLVAYLQLAHPIELRVHHHRVYPGTLVVDFSRGGRPLGVEIVNPEQTSLTRLNRLMKRLGLGPLTRAEISPLPAA